MREQKEGQINLNNRESRIRVKLINDKEKKYIVSQRVDGREEGKEGIEKRKNRENKRMEGRRKVVITGRQIAGGGKVDRRVEDRSKRHPSSVS